MPETTKPVNETNSPQTEPTPRKRRRWPRRIAILFLLLVVLLAVLVGFLPTIASSKAATDYGLEIANKQLKGSLGLEQLSVSWGGPIELRGLTATDSDGREVLNVKSVTYAGGLWRLVKSALDFGEIRIESPRVNLHVSADGQTWDWYDQVQGCPLPDTFVTGIFPDRTNRRVWVGTPLPNSPFIRQW